MTAQIEGAGFRSLAQDRPAWRILPMRRMVLGLASAVSLALDSVA